MAAYAPLLERMGSAGREGIPLADGRGFCGTTGSSAEGDIPLALHASRHA